MKSHTVCCILVIWGALMVNMAGIQPVGAQTWIKLNTSGEPPGARPVGIWGYDEATKRLITVRSKQESSWLSSMRSRLSGTSI